MAEKRKRVTFRFTPEQWELLRGYVKERGMLGDGSERAFKRGIKALLLEAFGLVEIIPPEKLGSSLAGGESVTRH